MNILISSSLLYESKERFDNLSNNIIWCPSQQPTKEDVLNADIIIGHLSLDLLKEVNKLKYLHVLVAGSDKYAIDEIKKLNVTLTNSTGCFSDSIAEYMTGGTIFALKDLGTYRDNQRKHLWQRNKNIKTIYDSLILVVGSGSIGMRYAEIMHAMHAHVIGFKRTPSKKPECLDELFTIDKLDEYLPQADVVALSLPQNSETRNLLNRDRINSLKQNALVINVGRGSAIDQEALTEALKEKRISAMLDVFKNEPLESDSELWDLDNVEILPHATGTENNPHTKQLLTDLAYDNLKAYLNNEPLKNIVDYNTGYKKSNT